MEVKVVVDSGKCVLHTRDSHDEDITKRSQQPYKWERTYSDDTSDLQSISRPGSPRKRPMIVKQGSGSSSAKGQVCLQESAVFYIPGLDVKVNYNSKTSDAAAATTAVKKANLYAWVSLQTVEETFVSPTVLDFLEQAFDTV
ncbi:PREDICTED: uncharacterized protein KIAA1109-like [Priapulus caudatus]|uniref:Uncharacterized protein KIAA1109-like n=1 Tax=Priapulus caudatus TaxID=37621 RepID=A0ABM1EX08_PRICU|nr:PREDICTED: uncharacterized protein KIAA1109-like [Priapulus caudatus]